VHDSTNQPNHLNKNWARSWADVKKEFRLISWTPKDQLVSHTKVVLMSAAVVGFAIYFIDLIFRVLITNLQQLIYILFA
jgi:preprotein translocase SecE subunit